MSGGEYPNIGILHAVERRKTEDRESFGDLLRGLRRKAGLSQEELALRAGLSPNAVSSLERGTRRRPYPHTVRSLAEALGLSPEEREALLSSVPGSGNEAVREAESPPASHGVSAFAPATSLVGREREVEELARVVSSSDVRLLTLTGVGGVGKTRLATEVSRRVGGEFPDGSVFISLASLSDPTLFASTVMRVLDQREAEGSPPDEALRSYLEGRRLLLVLDNFEQLLAASREVASLIESCPNLTILVTSRAPLRVRGEHEYPVQPLDLPASTRSTDERSVADSPSGKLFLERAKAARPDFEVTPENAADVAAICWRLAGLPLALELAAAKVRFLDPSSLLSRLDDALSTAWARDLPERQQTMRAALDWSYGLLSEDQRSLFRRLSVFTGGFPLEAAEAVGGASTLDRLGALVEQSLVATNTAGGFRYGMLEPVRQYASEKLEESGESGETKRDHASFFLELSGRAEPELRGPRQAAWLDALELENGNVRAAMDWALSAGEQKMVAAIGWGLHSFWWIRGHQREGRAWMEAALAKELPEDLRAKALHVAASTAFAQGDYEAAERRWRESLRLSRDAGDDLVEGNAWSGAGLVEMVRGDYRTAASNIEKAIRLFEKNDEDYLASVLRTFLGTTLLARGEVEGAEREFEAALEVAHRLVIPSLAYIALYNSAQAALAREDPDRAAEALTEGIRWSESTRDRANLAHFLEALAEVEASRGGAERAAMLLGAAEGSLSEVGAPVYNFYRPDESLRERAVSETRNSLGEESFEDFREIGKRMSFEEAVAYALEGAGSSELSP